MYHIVYLTTNLVNNRIYVGVHSTYNLEDGYLGSGKIINQAFNKYGRENFKRTILYYCISAEDAYIIEKNIIDDWFVRLKHTYNIAIGGIGGKREIVSSRLGRKFEDIFGIEKTLEIKQKISRKGYKHSDEAKAKISQAGTGKQHSDETKSKMSEKAKGKSKTDIAKNNMSIAKSLGNNPNARNWIVTTPNGEKFEFVGGIVQFFSDRNMCIKTARKFFNKGVITTHKKLKGWEFVYY